MGVCIPGDFEGHFVEDQLVGASDVRKVHVVELNVAADILRALACACLGACMGKRIKVTFARSTHLPSSSTLLNKPIMLSNAWNKDP